MTHDPAFESARSDLDAWRSAYPDDPYTSDLHLRLANAHYLTGTRLANIEAVGSHFGMVVAGRVRSLVESYEHHPPDLVAYDGAGRRVDRVRFDEGYHEAGRILWESGIVRLASAAGASFEQANLMYLAALEGEMGHLCAATCTTGLIRVLRRHADEATRERFIPALTDVAYDAALRGAQFLTEVQGGSDVGANATVAERAGDGSYRISGEKWFCSVVDADVFLLLARVPGGEAGTAGLGCFVVPRTVGGAPNGFRVRRLKEKLGTTCMASGEVDFTGALAIPVGEVGSGFKIMVTAMLNSSRWLNAVGNLGMMRRAYLEASAYARHRSAFGSKIAGYPLVRRQLASMKAEWLAALHSTWLLTHLDEAVDCGGERLAAGDVHLHRFLVNANKLVTSLAATGTLRTAIELLGGNGAIESFSVLPRLLRDCIVFEQWEGTHNVLSAQVLRDLGRMDLGEVVVGHLTRTVKGIGADEAAQTSTALLREGERLAANLARAVDDPSYGALHFRDTLERIVRALQAALLLEAATTQKGDLASELLAAAEWLVDGHLVPGYEPGDDPGFAGRIERLLGRDLDPVAGMG